MGPRGGDSREGNGGWSWGTNGHFAQLVDQKRAWNGVATQSLGHGHGGMFWSQEPKGNGGRDVDRL